MSFVSSNTKLTDRIINFSSFNGETFKREASSKYQHGYVYALGNYRNSPFVTGNNYYHEDLLKTEILNYGKGEWEEGLEYPFSPGDRYVSLIKSV